MGFGFKTKQRAAQTCAHTDEVTIEVAGLSRSVCESCGRVSVSYVGDAYPPEWVATESEDTATADSFED